MIGVLLVMFESQSALNNSQSEQNKSQSEQIKSQSEQIKSQSELIESQSSEIKHLTKRIETLTLTSCQQSLVTNPSLSERQPMRISMEKAVRERMVLIPQARKRSKRKKKKYL